MHARTFQSYACCAVSGHVARSQPSSETSRTAYSQSIEVSSQASRPERASERSQMEEVFKECESESCMLSTLLQPSGPPEVPERGPQSAPIIVSRGTYSASAASQGPRSRESSRRSKRRNSGRRKRNSAKQIFGCSDVAAAVADRLNAVLATRGGSTSRGVWPFHFCTVKQFVHGMDDTCMHATYALYAYFLLSHTKPYSVTANRLNTHLSLVGG